MNLEEFDIEISEPNEEDSVEVEIAEVPSGEPLVIIAEDDMEVTTADVEESNKSVEYAEWSSPEEFQDYILTAARKVPEIFENSPNSLKRAFAYLENLSQELTQGVEQDASYADLSEEQLRTLDTLEQGIELALKDLSASFNGTQRIKKIASKSAVFHTYINPFIYGLARTLINAKVSQGKNIEQIFAALDKKFKLDDREKLQLLYALNDLGHPIRSSFLDDAIDMMDQYQA
jgi:hypothetical protein